MPAVPEIDKSNYRTPSSGYRVIPQNSSMPVPTPSSSSQSHPQPRPQLQISPILSSRIIDLPSSPSNTPLVSPIVLPPSSPSCPSTSIPPSPISDRISSPLLHISDMAGPSIQESGQHSTHHAQDALRTIVPMSEPGPSYAPTPAYTNDNQRRKRKALSTPISNQSNDMVQGGEPVVKKSRQSTLR